MKTSFRKSFARDLKKVKNKDLLEQVRNLIEQVENATALQEIGDIKKMAGTQCYHRIRLGEYRLGVAVENDTIEFIRFLSRKDLYKYFP